MIEFIKAIWQTIVKQPRNTQLLLVAALIVLTISLLNPGEQQRPRNNLSEQNSPELIVTDPAAVEPTFVNPRPVDLILAEEPQAIAEPTPTTEAVPVPDSPATPFDPGNNSESIADIGLAYKLVLIIDDIGYNAEAGRRAISLPGQVTYAVIPYTPHGKALAELVHRENKEVMLHAPMSNLSGMDLGQGGLTLLQNEEEFVQTLRLALADIPHIKGVNNHTGSELTAALQPMQWVMRELKPRGLYFVDSVTTNISVAAATAEQYQVPSLRRHVFLDNVQTAEAIDIEFNRALVLAEKQGFAVAIGHPYQETLAYLEKALPLLAARNIQLVSASAMIERLQTPDPVETTSAW